jgi:putative NADH-flavin reductase
MTAASVRRLIVVGGAGTLEVAPGVKYLDTLEFPEQARTAASAHLAAWKVYSQSQLEWTVVSPAAEFMPGERTGRYRTAEGMLIKDHEGNSRISFEDYAIALLDEVENPKFLRKHMAVGY